MPVEKFRVLIPTTNGPVEIVLLSEEDPAIGRSVACIGGTTETADIAAAYHAFVARPTGVIERLFGHSCYRLDLSGRIDAGSSWQLGVLVAHALHAAGRLAQEKDEAAGVIWPTGSVRPVDLTIGAISHLAEKITHSLDRLKQEVLAGRRVLMAIPAPNAADIPTELAADLGAHGIELLELSDPRALCERLGLRLPGGPRGTPAEAGAPNQDPPARPARKWRLRGATAVRLLGTAVAAACLLIRAPAPAADPEDARQPQRQETAAPTVPAAEPQPNPPRQETVALIPEAVPFISTRNQAVIRSVYLPAPGHKALALNAAQIGFATAQRDREAAEAAALEACRRAADQAGASSRCELYAVDNVVVSLRGRPPMPKQPWVIRNPAIERPFVVADVPLASEKSRTRRERYARSTEPKAMALSERGIWEFYNAETVEEAARRALERCGSNAGAACMIVAVGDVFVVPIPRSAKILGFARPDTMNAVAPELREPLARRLGNATSGWNAVAVGASGRFGAGLGARTEQAAVDDAMAECGRQDRACRIAMIGPFLVEPGPIAGAASQATPLPVPATAGQLSRNVTTTTVAKIGATAKLDGR